MAYCPKCGKEVSAMGGTCPECGHDSSSLAGGDRQGLAYSSVANISLVIGQAVAGLAAVLMLIGSVIALVQGRLLEGLVVGPICFFLLAAVSVVFMRVQRP